MASIDPSPSAGELLDLQNDLKTVASSATAYLQTQEGKDDPNRQALADNALRIYVQLDNLSIAGLNLAVAHGGKAVDSINAATAELDTAIAQRKAISSTLNIVQNAAAFAAALAAGDVGSIISSGSDLVTSISNL